MFFFLICSKSNTKFVWHKIMCAKISKINKISLSLNLFWLPFNTLLPSIFTKIMSWILFEKKIFWFNFCANYYVVRINFLKKYLNIIFYLTKNKNAEDLPFLSLNSKILFNNKKIQTCHIDTIRLVFESYLKIEW